MLPSTRSTFQPGRASPSALTTAWNDCTRPSALTKVPGVSGHGAMGSSTALNARLVLDGLWVTTIAALESDSRARAAVAECNRGVQLMRVSALRRPDRIW